MKVYLKSKRGLYDAIGEYDLERKTIIVLKGSLVSQTVTYTGKFRGAAAIDRVRDTCVKDRKVYKDVEFKSASTAANFVTGVSTNGLQYWKTEEGIPLKNAIDN